MKTTQSRPKRILLWVAVFLTMHATIYELATAKTSANSGQSLSVRVEAETLLVVEQRAVQDLASDGVTLVGDAVATEVLPGIVSVEFTGLQAPEGKTHEGLRCVRRGYFVDTDVQAIVGTSTLDFSFSGDVCTALLRVEMVAPEEPTVDARGPDRLVYEQVISIRDVSMTGGNQLSIATPTFEQAELISSFESVGAYRGKTELLTNDSDWIDCMQICLEAFGRVMTRAELTCIAVGLVFCIPAFVLSPAAYGVCVAPFFIECSIPFAIGVALRLMFCLYRCRQTAPWQKWYPRDEPGEWPLRLADESDGGRPAAGGCGQMSPIFGALFVTGLFLIRRRIV